MMSNKSKVICLILGILLVFLSNFRSDFSYYFLSDLPLEKAYELLYDCDSASIISKDDIWVLEINKDDKLSKYRLDFDREEIIKIAEKFDLTVNIEFVTKPIILYQVRISQVVIYSIIIGVFIYIFRKK